MTEWILESLSHILGEDVSEDLTGYIMTIENPSDFEEYMKNILDFTNKEQFDLFENIRAFKFGSQRVGKNKSRTRRSNNNNTSISPTVNAEEATSPTVSSTSSTPSSDKKKKSKKFTKFQVSELQKGYLKEGRCPCECQATKHKLINNCLECGRIVCEQEGSGPCFYCDNMVCTKEELEILNSDSLQADVLYRTLNDRKISENYKKAMDDRNRMLEYDRTSAKRTTIIDDEHDYYDINNRWLSKKEREKAEKRYKSEQEQKNSSKSGARRITLDLINHKAVEDTGFTYVEEDDEDDNTAQNSEQCYKPLVPDVDHALQYIKQFEQKFKPKKVGLVEESTEVEENGKDYLRKYYTVQDKDLLEMRDLGMCLSMHQPWASLLLAGIKKHEGRTWYTPHRGILWIASTAKAVEPEDIKQCEAFYNQYYKNKKIVFPESYPTGCLLGRVLVQDCLTQEDYREVYPEGESESPNVLICSEPQMLPVGISMQGEHKIYKLKSSVHKMAREALIVTRRFYQ